MNKIIKKTIFSLSLSALIFSFAVMPVFAQSITETMTKAIDKVSLPGAGEGKNPDTFAQIIIGNIINAFISLFGAFFLILIIFGGFRWMNARGNQEETEKAKKILQSAVIGFILVMLAYAISFFVTSALQGAVTSTT